MDFLHRSERRLAASRHDGTRGSTFSDAGVANRSGLGRVLATHRCGCLRCFDLEEDEGKVMPAISRILVRTSFCYLILGSAIGTWLLLDKAASTPILEGVRNIHREIMLAGWIVQLVLGTATWILPRNDRSRGDMKSVWIAYALFNAGILVAAFGTVLENQAVLTAAHSCYAAGAVSFAKHAWPRIRSLPQNQDKPNARPP